jgi:transcription elongation factor Elf1
MTDKQKTCTGLFMSDKPKDLRVFQYQNYICHKCGVTGRLHIEVTELQRKADAYLKLMEFLEEIKAQIQFAALDIYENEVVGCCNRLVDTFLLLTEFLEEHSCEEFKVDQEPKQTAGMLGGLEK